MAGPLCCQGQRATGPGRKWPREQLNPRARTPRRRDAEGGGEKRVREEEEERRAAGAARSAHTPFQSRRALCRSKHGRDRVSPGGKQNTAHQRACVARHRHQLCWVPRSLSCRCLPSQVCASPLTFFGNFFLSPVLFFLVWFRADGRPLADRVSARCMGAVRVASRTLEMRDELLDMSAGGRDGEKGAKYPTFKKSLMKRYREC
ncbi:hypothetical protein HPB51_010772 [Rhipicephalus microplus]|uniref:Uncharacterized protein n=1 Tax=Rhipicephalus microplus TaxID=6941 RepID=A0A9J6DVF5_RHIMP|nr:hypothetical protein HPB51_010772 [Rhipicephalus microplus]